MKQTTIQFSKKEHERVTIQKLQAAIDLIPHRSSATAALVEAGLNGNFTLPLVKANILRRLDGKKVEVVKPILERKDFYRVMDLRKKQMQKNNEKRKIMSFYEQKKDSPFIGRVPLPSEVNLPKADTDMQELLKLSESKIVRTAKPRVRKKAVALPWWKRFLLYLLNQ
jgi:hypothetical protein